MSEQWEGLLEGAAADLKGHLTLERVTASRSGEKITVHFFQRYSGGGTSVSGAAMGAEAQFCSDAGVADRQVPAAGGGLFGRPHEVCSVFNPLRAQAASFRRTADSGCEV